jgi:hypothetical protein
MAMKQRHTCACDSIHDSVPSDDSSAIERCEHLELAASVRPWCWCEDFQAQQSGVIHRLGPVLRVTVVAKVVWGWWRACVCVCPFLSACLFNCFWVRSTYCTTVCDVFYIAWCVSYEQVSRYQHDCIQRAHGLSSGVYLQPPQVLKRHGCRLPSVRIRCQRFVIKDSQETKMRCLQNLVMSRCLMLSDCTDM